MARDTVEGAPPTLALMDIVARRNAFGRQVRSFEADLEVDGVAGASRCGPCSSARPGSRAQVPASTSLPPVEGHIVAAREGDVLVTAFHPELTDDTRLHELFIRMIRRRQAAAGAPDGATADCDAGEPGRAAAAAGHR